MCKFIIQITIMFISYSYSYAQLPSKDSLYKLVFVDEFNKQPDTSMWISHYPWSPGNFANCDTGRICKDIFGNGGTLIDMASLAENMLDTTNRTVSAGTCKLIAKKEHHLSKQWIYHPYPSTICTTLGLGANAGPDHCLEEKMIPYKYSNAMLYSRAKFKYGFFDIRFRLPGWSASSHNAVAPALWLYDNTPSIPASEIDVYEIQGIDGMFTNNIHVDAVNDANIYSADDPIKPDSIPFINLANWHTASLHWTPDYIDFYLDSTFIRRSVRDTNQYLIPMPLIIENAVGCGNFCTGNVDSILTPFPMTYEIEYMRVYQPKLACDTVKTYLTTNQALFKSKIYKSLKIGGTTGSATFNNASATAVGVDYVLLDEGFEAGGNMEMVIKTSNCWTDQTYIPHAVINPSPQSTFFERYIKNRGTN